MVLLGTRSLRIGCAELHLDAFVVVPENHVDDARQCVGAIDRRRAVGEDLHPFYGRKRDGIEVNGSRARERIARNPPAVNENRRSRGPKTPQIDEGNLPKRSAGPLPERSKAVVRRAAQNIGNGFKPRHLDFRALDHGDGARRIVHGSPNPRPRDDHLLDLFRGPGCVFLRRHGPRGQRRRGDRTNGTRQLRLPEHGCLSPHEFRFAKRAARFKTHSTPITKCNKHLHHRQASICRLSGLATGLWREDILPSLRANMRVFQVPADRASGANVRQRRQNAFPPRAARSLGRALGGGRLALPRAERRACASQLTWHCPRFRNTAPKHRKKRQEGVAVARRARVRTHNATCGVCIVAATAVGGRGTAITQRSSYAALVRRCLARSTQAPNPRP